VTIAGYKPRNHPQQVNLNGAVDEVDDRGTSPETFAEVAAAFGPFTLDVAASSANAKCDRFFDLVANGLAQPWDGEAVWCNPPYSDIAPWVAKAWRCYFLCRSVTLLLPAVPCEQPWWQELVEPYRDQPGSPLRTVFLAGRRPFIMPASQVEPSPQELMFPGGEPSGVLMKNPPFGVVVLDWRVGGPFGGAP